MHELLFYHWLNRLKFVFTIVELMVSLDLIKIFD